MFLMDVRSILQITYMDLSVGVTKILWYVYKLLLPNQKTITNQNVMVYNGEAAEASLGCSQVEGEWRPGLPQ